MISSFFQEVKNLEKKISTPSPFTKIQSGNVAIFFFWVKNMAKFFPKKQGICERTFHFQFCFLIFIFVLNTLDLKL